MAILGTTQARVIGVAAAVTVAAGVTLGVTTLLGVTFSGGGSAPAEDVRRPAERDRLAICVEAVEVDADGKPAPGDSALEVAAKSTVEDALVDVMKHAWWEPAAGYGGAQPVVDIGCPSPPVAMAPGVEWREGFPVSADARDAPGFEVAQRSYYQIFVFIMPSLDDIDNFLGGTRGRVAPQELECETSLEGKGCSHVTSAIYVTPEEIQRSSPLLVDLLEQAAGLRHRVP